MKWSEFLIHVLGSEHSKVEMTQLNSWKESGEINAKIIQEMSVLNSDTQGLSGYKDYDVDAALAATMAVIGDPEPPVKNKSYRNVILLAAGALLLALAGYFLSQKPADLNVLYAETEILEELRSDGTSFTLQKGATLTENSKNSYVLSGDAYFDVKPQEQPLEIKTTNGIIRVVGTSFMIKANELKTEVFMNSGQVEFIDRDQKIHKVSMGEAITATPAEVTLNENARNNVTTYWATQLLSYNNETLANVYSDLQRLFDKELPALDKEQEKLTITAEFNDNSLEEIISELKVITGLDL